MWWCHCERQCQVMLPQCVHPILLHHHSAGKVVGVVCLWMKIHQHGRNEFDALSEGPRSPYKCVYTQEYKSKVGVCACINVYMCLCVYTHSSKTGIGWKVPERVMNSTVGKRSNCPLSLGSHSQSSSAKDNGRKPKGKKGMGGGKLGWASSDSQWEYRNSGV